MPTWPVHLAIANKLVKKYKFSEDFIIGNVIPDTMNGYVIDNPSNIFHHTVTHYSEVEPLGVPRINIGLFLNDNRKKLSNELILGAYCHLLTDLYFNEYTMKNHTKEENGILYAVLKDGSLDKNVSPMTSKQNDFKVFGDGFIKNKEVGNEVRITKETIDLSKELNYQIEKEDIFKTVDKINEIVNGDIKKQEDYQMFTEKELISVYNNCYEYIDKTINNLNNDKGVNEMLEKKYNHKEVEKNKYNKWLEKEYFKCGDKTKEPFTIILPPPNVTGNLHLGHAWDVSIQDIVARYKRMNGFDVLWLPGTDHAAIATEAKVVAKLKKEGIDKYDLGREKFLEKCWEWTEEYGGNIRKEWANMGLSLDYSKERFTLDEYSVNAVNKAFIEMYNKGLIYRGKRIINWDPEAKTALSNEEVIYKDTKGAFYHIKYFIEGTKDYLDVATTRPETLFGDTAVAVNPKDDRYKHLIGKNIIVPIVNRVVPIIGDSHADIEKGTGVVKITPAHDPNDFEVGFRHNLEQIVIMDETAHMNEETGKYYKMDRFECREKIVEELKEKDLLIKIEEITHSVGYSERTNVMVEPYLSEQWFVKMKKMCEDLIEMQKDKNKKVNFIPKRYEKILIQKAEECYDWCISRQLWWGIRIPIWYKDGDIKASVESPGEGWKQDEDVLDTWFSSALWPFSTLGWAMEDDSLYKRYFPTNFMSTGYDILFFWVFRMMFQSQEFTNQNPFKECYIHGLIRAKDGRKMSKSLGNGVEPSEMVEKYGADALRYYLTTNSAAGLDLRFDEEKMASTWNFINKLWNASRFVLMNIEDLKKESLDNLKLEDKWILTKLNKTIKEVRKNMDKYELNLAGSTLYNFIWEDFCDNYIELSKSSLNDNTTKTVLLKVLTSILKMLHPYMPYVTEEIYSMLPIKDSESIMISSYPKYNKNNSYIDEEQLLNKVLEDVTNIRNLKVNNNITKESSIKLETSKDLESIYKNALKIKEEQLITGIPSDKEEYNYKSNYINITFYQDGKVINKELLISEIEKLEQSIKKRENLLANENYVTKAPAHVVELDRQKLKEEQEKLNYLREQL